jgi:hypothetical protein
MASEATFLCLLVTLSKRWFRKGDKVTRLVYIGCLAGARSRRAGYFSRTKRE